MGNQLSKEAIVFLILAVLAVGYVVVDSSGPRDFVTGNAMKDFPIDYVNKEIKLGQQTQSVDKMPSMITCPKYLLLEHPQFKPMGSKSVYSNDVQFAAKSGEDEIGVIWTSVGFPLKYLSMVCSSEGSTMQCVYGRTVNKITIAEILIHTKCPNAKPSADNSCMCS